MVCFIEGPKPKKHRQKDIIELNYQTTPFSTSVRNSYDFISKEWKYFSENVRRSFEEILIEDKYQNSCITVNIIVVQNNGSIQSTIINAISLAFLDAGI